MDIFKDKEILEYFGIYGKRELSQKEEEKYQKIRKQIEKIIEEPIEKMYLIEENAWGNPNSEEEYEDVIFIAVDKRFKDLNRAQHSLIKFFDENNMGFVLTSLCRYEKEENINRERIHYR